MDRAKREQSQAVKQRETAWARTHPLGQDEAPGTHLSWQLWTGKATGEAEAAAQRAQGQGQAPSQTGSRARRAGRGARGLGGERQQGQSPGEGWVSTRAVGEGATGRWGRQGAGGGGPAGLREGASCRAWGRAAAGHGRCRGGRDGGLGGQLGGVGQLPGGRSGCRWPLPGPWTGAEPLPQGAGRRGLGLPLLLQAGGLGALTAAADTPPVAVVGQLPAHLWRQPTGPLGAKGRWVMAPLVTASWKEGSGGDWAWVPDPWGALAGTRSEASRGGWGWSLHGGPGEIRENEDIWAGGQSLCSPVGAAEERGRGLGLAR